MIFQYSKTFEKQFSKYQPKLQKQIFDAIQKIPDGNIKKMIGNEVPPIYRLRVSKYRVLFLMEDDIVKILKVDSRGDIYK
jgi:mRNA interferase RelE/StbE